MDPSAQERAFATEVERYRAAARVSQDWVARQVGMSRPKISEVCAGRYVPTRQTLDNLVVALAMEPNRAVELWQAACDGRRQRVRAGKLARYPTPDKWTELPVLPAEVQTLLRAEIEAATDMPYRLRGARATSLATVYVRQDLGSSIEDAQEQPRPQPVLDERGLLFLPAPPTPRLTIRPPSRAVRDALDGHDHLVVTGGPGQGKSTLSLRLTAEIANRWLNSDDGGLIPLAEPVVPLRLTARVLATRLELPFPQALADSALAEFGSLLTTEITSGMLETRVAGCRWLLLIDGLDEVADPIVRDRLVKALALRMHDSPYRVVLTTRPIEGATLAPMQRAAARYELQPFNDEAFRSFAERWFDEPAAAARFLHEVRQAHLDELVRVPLLATIAAIIFEQHRSRPLPDNQYALYEAYLEFLRSGRTFPPGPFEHLLAGLLEHLGLVRLEVDTPLSEAARDWVAQRIVDLPLGWADELVTFLSAVGPLVRRSDGLQFLHHSFAEHLAATGMARMLPEKYDAEHDGFVRLLHAARQEDAGRLARAVLLHFAHLHPDQADPLLTRLHMGTAEEQLIAAQLLAQHVPASSDVVNGFLVTAKEWASVTRYTAGEILNQVCRAAHHPGLAAWLVHLMRDSTMPWRSRVTAAAALATTIQSPNRDEAISLLRTVIDNATVLIRDRLAAANALAQCGPTEQTAAQDCLRSVLTDPRASAYRRKEAAVVLAGLGPQGRTDAVRTLTTYLDEPETPAAVLVELAAGLVEISDEFRERAAGAFRKVLHSHAHTMAGREDAAIGLATLGSEYLAEVVDSLTRLVTDRRRYAFERTEAATALARMGSQHRQAAARHVQAMLAEPDIDSSDVVQCAKVLAGLGSEFHNEAVTYLTAIAVKPTVNTNAWMWAALALASIGPEFQTVAAAELRRLADDPLAEGFERARALSQLAEFGAQFRAEAVQRLRTILHDADADTQARRWAADDLLDLGTEFHTEIGEVLLSIAETDGDPNVVIDTCWTLSTLGQRFFQPVAEIVLLAIESPTAEVTTLMNATNLLPSPAAEQAREALLRVLTAPTRSEWARIRAARHFIRSTESFTEAAIETLLRMLRQSGGPDLPVDRVIVGFESAGDAYVDKIAEALRALLSVPHLGPARAWQTASALISLGLDESPEVVATLAAATSDESASMRIRCAAAIELATVSTDHTSVTVAMLRDMARTEDAWHDAVLGLDRLGEDVLPLLRATLANGDASRGVRQNAAELLAELDPTLIGVAAGELRDQATDQYLDFWYRVDAVVSWAGVASSARDDAVSFFSAIVGNEHEPADERSYAAYQLVLLDRSRWPTSVALLRRLLADPRVTPEDQLYVAEQLRELKALRSDEVARLAMAVAHHPEASPGDRASAASRLSGPTGHAIRLELLADHAVPIGRRLPGNAFSDDETCVPQAKAALREVCTAIEFGRSERVVAARELGELAPRLIPDAVCFLRKLAVGDDDTAFEALRALARLDGPWWHEVVDSRERVVADNAQPHRRRLITAMLLVTVRPTMSAPTSELLRHAVSDERTPHRIRVAILFALRHTIGLDPLRSIRDNQLAAPHIRQQAANLLMRYTADDRAAAARMLHAISTDATARPALRWRAADDLAGLGSVGRAHAIDVLADIMADDRLPATARAHAAQALAQLQPTRHDAARHQLRNLATVEDPLRRVRVLLALGSLDTIEAVPRLRRMADNHALGPVVRLRCAEALVELRRDQRETAAALVRELAHDACVPWHVRTRAAQDLARWSALCREEARDLLYRLHATGTC